MLQKWSKIKLNKKWSIYLCLYYDSVDSTLLTFKTSRIELRNEFDIEDTNLLFECLCIVHSLRFTDLPWNESSTNEKLLIKLNEVSISVNHTRINWILPFSSDFVGNPILFVLRQVWIISKIVHNYRLLYVSMVCGNSLQFNLQSVVIAREEIDSSAFTKFASVFFVSLANGIDDKVFRPPTQSVGVEFSQVSIEWFRRRWTAQVQNKLKTTINHSQLCIWPTNENRLAPSLNTWLCLLRTHEAKKSI